MKQDDYADPDDMFADTRMTFGEHIEDLRTHLIRAIKGFVVGMIIALFLAKPILGVMLAPVEAQLQAFDKRSSAGKADELQQLIAKKQLDVPRVEFLVWQKRKNFNPLPDVPADPKAIMPRLVPALHAWLRSLSLDDKEFNVAQFVDPTVANSGEWEEVQMLMPEPVAWAKMMQEIQLLIKPHSIASMSIQ